MSLAVVVLVRDEADIFPAFAQHLAALFDFALFLDHGSTDGTTAQIERACAERPGWARWHVEVRGLHQALFTNFALRHVFATTPADAVVLLDADEFIDVPDRDTLHAMLAGLPDARTVPCLAWINTVPLRLDDAPVQLGDRLLAAPSPSPFLKVIVTRALFTATGGRVALLAGNHVLDPGDGQNVRYETVGIILHLPLRSLEQMRRKTVAAALAHMARTDRPEHEGAHRFDGLRRLQAATVGEADLLGWAARYGEDGAASSSASFDALLRAGFAERALDVAHVPGAPMAQAAVAASPWAFIAGQLLGWRPLPGSGLELFLDGAVLRARRAGGPPEASGVAADLAAARAACEALRAENALLRASTSWQATAPLRALARWLGSATKTRR